MKILFLCTAHNSLSQRLFLALSRSHDVSIEYALSDELMVSAVALSGPDLVICPFLTTLVPKEIYENVLTLIIHPGPPGDVGPSALDWLLMGDDGSVDDANKLLQKLDAEECFPGRTHWGITVLQAIEEFDAGPVWAFEDFEIDIDQPGLTKSELYRTHVTHAAITATLTAITRIQGAPLSNKASKCRAAQGCSPALLADPKYGRLAVSTNRPFQGGKLHHRPLLKAAQREFDVTRHTARQISRRIRCADSQPGVLSKVFGPSLYLYGGIIDECVDGRLATLVGKLPSAVLGHRNEAVCISASDGKGVWITHVRRPKTKNDSALWPKVPAITGLLELGLITAVDIETLSWPLAIGFKRSPALTFQEVWVDMQIDEKLNKTAYVYFDFYNGAMATEQCSQLIDAMDLVLSESIAESPIQAIVLMGGSYFSNGIALNVIEAAADPSLESWLNINRIDDVVHYLLHEFPSRGIVTIAAIRGNAAAGGVALATACDIVVAGAGVVLNPAYRGVGLYGSEYHTLSYYGRCGKTKAQAILRAMTPMSPLQAQSIGLVDYVFPGTGTVLEDYVRTHIAYLLKPGILKRGLWKRNVEITPASLARARAQELGEMSLDFWSARSIRYHTRRFDFVRKVKASQTPLRFATHRKKFDESRRDEEETDTFDSVEHFQRLAQEKLLISLRAKLAAEVDNVIAASKQNATTAALSVVEDMVPSRRTSVAATTTTTTTTTATSTTSVAAATLVHELALEKKGETLFSCYYKPVAVAELPTPPDSPFSPGELFDRVILA